MNSRTRAWIARWWRGVLALWPHVLLAIILGLVGALNIVYGLKLPVKLLQRVQALHGIAGSLSAVGGTAQVILGVMLVVASIGLVRRLSFAWSLAVLLLAIALGVNAVQPHWGFNLWLMGALLVALFLFKNRFTRRTVLASVLLSLSSIFAILAYGTFGSYLLGTDFRPPIRDLGTAFYYTIVTLSTVGYGDIVPDKPHARWFAVSLLVVGLSVFASALASVLGPTISGELDRIFKPKESKVEPKDHVILVGEGAIARNTAKELKRRKMPFVQIVTGQGEAPEGDHQVIEGDPTDDDVLCQAGIHRARMVIAAGEDDGENAFIALVAKDLNPNVKMLALASSALVIRRLKLARADLVFSPAAVGSRLLADLVEGIEISPEFQDLLEGRTGSER